MHVPRGNVCVFCFTWLKNLRFAAELIAVHGPSTPQSYKKTIAAIGICSHNAANADKPLTTNINYENSTKQANGFNDSASTWIMSCHVKVIHLMTKRKVV